MAGKGMGVWYLDLTDLPEIGGRRERGTLRQVKSWEFGVLTDLTDLPEKGGRRERGTPWQEKVWYFLVS